MNPRSLTVLTGNGLSIAINPGLTLPSITEEVMKRIRAASVNGDDVVKAMEDLANHALESANGNSGKDFEALIGAFGAETRTLDHLERMRTYTNPADEELRDAIQKVAIFAEQVRDQGLSHVLQVIFERSDAPDLDLQPLRSLLVALNQQFSDQITYANLNYDMLLSNALVSYFSGQLADLAHGYQKVSFSAGGETYSIPSLRKILDLPSGRRIKLVHLHGSVAFWGRKEDCISGKLSQDQLRTIPIWDHVRKNSTVLRPLVVLASPNDKTRHVQDIPFKIAYEAFDQSLSSSQHWLIIGYSFRDVPVNEKLKNAFNQTVQKPKVLVVTYGEELLEETILNTFGWGVEQGAANWLTIDRGGAARIEQRKEWHWFTG